VLTVDAVMALRPCYTRDRVTTLFAGRESLSATDISTLPIPPQDRLWVILRMAPREVWMPAIYACAERAIRHASWALHRHGQIGESEWLEFLPPIVDAASAGDAAWAARAAARDAARAAAWAAWAAGAARDAEWAAAGAAGAAAEAAEYELTIAHVARLVEEGEKR
jgi:hypothetical protein